MAAAIATFDLTTPPTCHGCGGALAEKFPDVEDPQTNERFAIAACERCGLGETRPQPDDLGKYYGSAYHGGRHSFTARYCAHRRERLVQQTAGSPRGGRLLDVGCGDGTFLLGARSRGWDVAGTELNPVIAQEAGLRVWSRLEEAGALAPYRCITLWHTLEHMRAPRDVLRQVAQWLEPGGTVIVAVPNAQGLQARLFGPRWFHLDVPRHLFHFGADSLTRMLAGVGLDVTRTYHMEVEYDLFGWAQSALNLAFRPLNLFFNQVTGRALAVSALSKVASFGAGTALTALSIPLAATGALASSGGVLIVAARKPA